MRRWLPRLALLLLGVLSIALGGLWYLARGLDLVALEAQLALAVRERTGQDLRVEGIALELLPFPGLGVEGVALGAAPGFGPEPMLTIERAHARVRLLPLLHGELALSALVLDGVELRLERREGGQESWASLVDHLQAPRDPSRATRLPSVGRVSLRNARVYFRDAASGRDLDAAIAQGSVGPLAAGQPARLSAQGTLDSSEPPLRAAVTLEAQGALEGSVLVVSALALDAGFEGAAIPGGARRVHLDAPLRLDPGAGSLAVERFEADLQGAALVGSLSAVRRDEAFEGRGVLEASTADLGGLLDSLGHPGALPAELRGASNARFAWGWDGTSLLLDDLRAQVDSVHVTGSAFVARLDPLTLRLDLAVDALDVDRYASSTGGPGNPASPTLPPELRVDGHIVIGQVTAGGFRVDDLRLPLSLHGSRLVVEGATAQVLGGTVTGGLGADLGAEPRLRIRAQAERLDLALLREAAGVANEASGELGFEADLTTGGSDRQTLLANLDGRFCTFARLGALGLTPRSAAAASAPTAGTQAARLGRHLGLVRDRLVAKARERVDAERPERLEYRRMGGCFRLIDGVAYSDDLVLLADWLELRGAGSLDLPAEQLDVSCDLTVEQLPPMALRVHGSMDDPQVELDTPEALEVARYRVAQQRAAWQARIEQQRGELEAQLEERREVLRDELRARTDEPVGRLLDQREQALERRDELKDQLQGAKDELRGRLKRKKEALLSGHQGDAAPDGEGPAEDAPEQGSETPPAAE